MIENMLIAVLVLCGYAIYILAWWMWVEFNKDVDMIAKDHADRMAAWDTLIKSYEKRIR